MQVLQSKHDVGSVELCCILLEPSNLTQVEKEFATRAVLKAEIKLAFRLEGIVHFHNKLVINALLKVAKKQDCQNRLVA